MRAFFITCVLTVFFFCSLASGAQPPQALPGHPGIQLQLDPRFSTSEREHLQAWLAYAVNALKTVYGELPQSNFVVAITPAITAATIDSEAVPWGEVRREYPMRLILHVNPAALGTIKSDWTIYHELSHLLVPFNGGDARWASEGMASYYQNVLQVRAGLINEEKFWQKLVAGFERGRAQNYFPQQRLDKLGSEMRENYSFMRVYWSGALYWLEIDVALRLADSSLDAALLQLKRCCEHKRLSMSAIIDRLQKLYPEVDIAARYQQFAASKAIPGYSGLLTRLGVNVRSNSVALVETLQLGKPGESQNVAKLHALRSSIATPLRGDCSYLSATC